MTHELADLENPQFGTRIWDISPSQAEFSQFCCNTQVFCYMVTAVRRRQVINDIIKSADPENGNPFANEIWELSSMEIEL